MSILSSRRRWAVPAAVMIAIGALAGGTAISASAEPRLPQRTAAQLLVDLQTARIDGLSGTVVHNADLDLPALPVPGGGQGSSTLSSLISGSHTLRVWTAGTGKVRVALLGTLGESDVIRNGNNVWIWSSTDNHAVHTLLSEPDRPNGHRRDAGKDGPLPPLTPQDAAERVLAAIDPTTAVSTDGTAKVAGRAAYELVLTPRDTRTLVGQVRLAVDAARHIPLRVQVYARGTTDPALEIGFTHVSFGTPDDRTFRFSPPPGATVTTWTSPGGTAHDGAATRAVIGAGWTQVLVVPNVGRPGPAATGGTNAGGAYQSALAALPRVFGPWGSGRLVRSNLFTALITDDGRLIAGMVGPDLIYQAAAHR